MGPSIQNVEIEGTEPYIVGGHTASGYWVDTDRETTIRGLFAAGDAAGGCPQKYVTGAFVEGGIAAKAAMKYMEDLVVSPNAVEIEEKKRELEVFLSGANITHTADKLEMEMQTVMDKYAGGISVNYRFTQESLVIADAKIREIGQQAKGLSAGDPQELIYILELVERLTLCRSVIAHLSARKETRWHTFAERPDYPERNGEYDLFVNSRLVSGEIEILFCPLVKKGVRYEH